MSDHSEYRMPEVALTLAFSRDDVNQPCLAVGEAYGGIVLWTQSALKKGERCFHKLQGYKGVVRSVAFNSSSSSSSSGGGHQQQLLASGSSDETVRLWDTHTKECVAVFEGHTNWVNSVAFSPDNRLLASASDDRTVRLWDVMERRAASPVHVLYGHIGHVWSVSFSTDGRQLASGSFDHTVRLWSVPEGVPGPVLHPHAVYCVAFSPVVGSNMLASGSIHGIISLWDVGRSETKPQLLRELQGHSDYIDSLAFSPDGSQLISGSYDKTVRLWNVTNGKLLKTLTGHSGHVTSVAFHPNGKQVASCAYENTVRIWTVCEWSDRTHQLFGEEMKRLVFCLMCVRDRLEMTGTKTRGFPRLPMALWLEIFGFLYV
jgi:WD40 repeat protein